MPRLFSPSTHAAEAALWGPALIAVGLAILILAAWWPAAPIVSAMALLTLGATGATLARFGSSPSLRTILPVHIVVYAGMYALFVGASQHAAATQTGGGNLWQTIDLAASIGPMTVAAWLSWKALRLLSGAG
jgi:hypothetical protein